VSSRQAPPKYRTIVADPPWVYDRAFVSFTHNGEGPRIERDLPYESMAVEDIASLPIPSLAEKDCRLFLWTTNRYLPDSFGVLRAWGFEYVQTLVWRKTGNPSPFGGSVAPNHAEYLLVGKRGAPAILSRLSSSVIDAPAAVFGHSTKPEAFLDHIEAVSPGPYLELFSRRARLGWDTHGDESLSHVELSA
jgi:N6-adenosine-specific RNA methylase IME4